MLDTFHGMRDCPSEATAPANIANLQADEAIVTEAKSPPNVAAALCSSPTRLQPPCRYGIFTGRQDGRWLRPNSTTQVEIPEQDLGFVAEVSDYFMSSLALSQTSQPRDWRKLSGLMGGDWRGMTQNALQGLLPSIAFDAGISCSGLNHSSPDTGILHQHEPQLLLYPSLRPPSSSKLKSPERGHG